MLTLSSLVMYIEAYKNCGNSHAVCDLEEDACPSLSSLAQFFCASETMQADQLCVCASSCALTSVTPVKCV